MFFLTPTSGELSVELHNPAHLYHQDHSKKTDVGPGIVALQTGDTLISPQDFFPGLWNLSTTDASFLALELSDSQDHLVRPERMSRCYCNGKVVISANLTEDVKSLDISIERMVIGPGETFA